jgi:GTP1/Obg family GTP-binding protein
MVTIKQIKTAQKRTHKTARKFASLEREYNDAVEKSRKTGKKVRRSLVSRFQKAKSDYTQAVAKYKKLYNAIDKEISPDQFVV